MDKYVLLTLNDAEYLADVFYNDRLYGGDDSANLIAILKRLDKAITQSKTDPFDYD